MAQAISNQKKSEEYVFVVLDVHQWSGRKKATPDEFGVSTKGLPEQVLTFGHKKLYDPKKLRVYSNFAREAERELDAVGRKTPIGWLVPPSAALGIASKLEEIQRRFYAQKRVDEENFLVVQMDWANRFPEHKEKILGDSSLKDNFAAQLNFDHMIFVVKAVEESDAKAASKINAGFNSVRDGVYGKLLIDTVKASSSLDKALNSNERITAKTFNNLRELCSKLKGLSCYDNRIRPLWAGMVDTLNEMPREGSATPQQIERMQELLKVLTNHEEFVRRLDAGEALVSPVTESPVQADASQMALIPETAVSTPASAPATAANVW